MSVVLLKELYTEVSRLYIAGSDLAAGDFRLKRLVPGLLQAGEKAPIFKRLGEGAQGLAEPEVRDDNAAAARLQELTLLLSSVLHTQGGYAPEGELRELDTFPMKLTTDQSYRRVSEVIDALGKTGSGRHEIVVQAFEDGLFRDLRLVQPAIRALHDPYAELAYYACDVILPAYGRAILPLLRESFDPAGGKGDARAVGVLAKLAETAEEWAEVYAAADGGSAAVREAAIPMLAGRPEYEEALLRWIGDGKKAIRAVAYIALAESGSDQASRRLYEAMSQADASLAADALYFAQQHTLAPQLARDALALLEEALTADGKLKGGDAPKQAAALQQRLPLYWRAMYGKDSEEKRALVQRLLDAGPQLHKLNLDNLLHEAAQTVVASPSPELLAKLRRLEKVHASYLYHAYEMAGALLSPAEVYDAFASYDRGAYKDELVDLMETELARSHWQEVERTWEGAPGYEYVTKMLSESEMVARYDRRWLPWALARKATKLVAMLVSKTYARTPEEVEAVQIAETFLLGEMEKAFKDFQDDFVVVWEGLRRCGADPAISREAMLRGLEKRKRLRYHLNNSVFYELKKLPADYRERLEALRQQAGHEAAQQLQIIIESMSEVQA